MRILEWVHRKLGPKRGMLHSPKDYPPGPEVLDEEYPRGDTLTLQFNDWQHGLLTIGTFGLDAQFDGKEAAAHALKVVQVDERRPFQKEEFVNVIVGLRGDIDGANPNVTVDDKSVGCKSSDKDEEKINAEYEVGMKIHTLKEFFKVGSPLGDSVPNGKKSSAVQPLGNCLFGKGSSDKLIDVKRGNRDNKEKADEIPEKRGCSLVKKIRKWKIKGSRSSELGLGKCSADSEGRFRKTSMQRMRGAVLIKKIQPDGVAGAMRGIGSGYLSPSQTFNQNTVNEPRVNNTANRNEDDEYEGCPTDLITRNAERNEKIDQYSNRYIEEEVGSSSTNSITNCEEPFSLSRDNSDGSRGYWVKTDSEYVVLEL